MEFGNTGEVLAFTNKYFNEEIPALQERNGITEEERNLVYEICRKHKLDNFCFAKQDEGEVCIYAVLYLGTNGAERSIKNSLKQVYDLLDELDKDDKVDSSNVTHLTSDLADDVYDFVILVQLKKV
jgi:hypothetical protein